MTGPNTRANAEKIRNSEFVSPHTKNPSLQRVIFMNSGNVKDLDHKH